MAVQYRGANLAGGDTAYTGWAGSVPVSGTHYNFVSNADVDYLLSKGCNCFRLLFSWEAIQPSPNGGIPSVSAAHKTYYDTFKSRVDYITLKGASVIIDIHSGIDADFAAYFGAKIGTTYQTYSVEALFVGLWSKLATIFKSNLKVMFGLMNEPSNMPTMTWFAAAQKAINAIRVAGAANKIVCPGNGFTAASTWSGSLYSDTGSPLRSNAYGWLNAGGAGVRLSNPGNNLALQVHLYADSGGGGGASDVVSGTVLVDRVKGVVEWGRANGVQVFVAEVGLAGGTSTALSAWQGFTDYCDANSDVVLGWTFWAYGPISWWSGYRFSLCPSPDYKTDSPQMKMIASALAPAPPFPSPAPVDPTIALKAQIADLQTQVSNLTQLKAVSDTALGALQSKYNILDGDYAQLRTAVLQAQNVLSVGLV